MSPSAKRKRWICRIGRFLLGAVFVYSALAKLASPQDFADKIAAYQILPVSVINLLAMGLPLFELACGMCVLSGFYLRMGALGLLGMLTIFVGALVIAALRGLSVECGCFGPHSWLDSNPWIALSRDLFFLAITGVIYAFGQRPSYASEHE